MSEPARCANRTYVKSFTTMYGIPGKGWVANCIACAGIKYGETWRETYDWADAHASRGWNPRSWIPHTITLAGGEQS